METGEGRVIFSVIIPSYNSEKTIDACLASVTGQRTALPYEVIVVDSSDDNTKNIINNCYPDSEDIIFGS
jgi:glycosyltransferase involved in cell wall biosynthesis